MELRLVRSSRVSVFLISSHGRVSISDGIAARRSRTTRARFEFTGNLIKVTVTMDDDQKLDADGIRRVQMAQE